MKVYQTDDVRNVALVGGAKSGKTTLAEAMLFEGKIINRRGAVEDNNTVSDYREIELAKGSSVTATVLYAEYEGKKINILDTPGTPDYVGEVVSSAKVANTALLIASASEGLNVGVEIGWRNTEMLNSPVIFVLNQLDHENAKFNETIADLKDSFSSKITPVQYPVNQGDGFDSIIDLMLMKMLKFSGDGKCEVLDIPAEEADRAQELNLELVEAAAEGSEELMEKYFETDTLTIEEMREGIRLGTRSRSIFPAFCISAKNNIGVGRLMQFLTASSPTPYARGYHTEEGDVVEIDATKPPSLYVFKTSVEPHLGEVSYFKVITGVLKEGSDMYNARTGNKERMSQIMVVAGKKREKVTELYAGDIGAAVKLKDVRCSDTLNDISNKNQKFRAIQFPNPIFFVAGKAVNSHDDEKVGLVINEISKMDPSLRVEYSRELKQMIISGMGEQHINNVKWVLTNNHKVEIDFKSPRIPYRETITKSAKADYRHKKQSGGSGQFGEVHMMIQPYVEGYKDPGEFKIKKTEEHQLPWGGKLVMKDCIVGGSIDARFQPAILKGIMERMEQGPLTGSYARDIIVYIYDGKMHAVDSNELSFKLAGRFAFIAAFKNAGPKIMEPVYNVSVLVPEDMMGNVMTDLQGRRAIIMGMDAVGKMQRINAKVPLAEMDRYATALSSITSGHGMYSMDFDEYQQVPTDVQNVLLKKYEEEEANED